MKEFIEENPKLSVFTFLATLTILVFGLAMAFRSCVGCMGSDKLSQERCVNTGGKVVYRTFLTYKGLEVKDNVWTCVK